jgi:hypothetical protein
MEEFLCIVHDKMDHSKILLMKFQVKSKMVVKFNQLLSNLTRMIVHEHGDETLFNIPTNSNQITILISPLDFFPFI